MSAGGIDEMRAAREEYGRSTKGVLRGLEDFTNGLIWIADGRGWTCGGRWRRQEVSGFNQVGPRMVFWRVGGAYDGAPRPEWLSA